MNLYIDIGNSRIRFAAAERSIDQLAAYYYKPDTLPSVFRQYSSGLQTPARVLVANVADNKVAAILTDLCETAWSIRPEYLKTGKVCCGVTNAYTDPGQLGVDRWLAMIAAWNKYKDNLCIIDCGSAVTADLVSADGRHQGGYIIPGSYMQQQALVNTAGQITISSEYKFSEQAGRSTDECVYNGTTLAVTAFIEYILRSINAAGEGKYHCVITGGGADAIMKILKIDFRHDPLLVIEGIRLAGKG